MKARKILVSLAALALVAAISIGGTIAYLTSTDKVENTFTVGKVNIVLDEAKANTDGTLVEGAKRVQANEYHLLPGHTYNKDPMVTVKGGSEDCYVKMTVTFTNAKELDAIFASEGGADMTSIFKGYSDANWIAKNITKDETANTRTYEFWYKEKVESSAGDNALDALFDQIVVPGEITKEQLATIEGMKIIVNAYAVQADGFKDAAEAWTTVKF